MSPSRNLVARFGVAAIGIVAAIAGELLLPAVPRFALLFPAVLLATLLGGRITGLVALCVTAAAAASPLFAQEGLSAGARLLGLACFLGGGIFAIEVAVFHRHTEARLRRERSRMQAALEAAHAAVWELSADGTLYWDENFYRLVGLDPAATPPATPTFLSMILPEDREQMAEARRLMDQGIEPRRVDEYRLRRPDGEVVWLENHRRRISDGESYFIGITQDITRRKLAEERVQALLREADHRAKNQFAVIMAIARETRRTSESAADFDEAFGARLRALARSHDLLTKGNWNGTTVRELLLAHLEPFGAAGRYELVGPDLVVPGAAAQQLGMAFHELSTNAAKHGALASGAGHIRVAWEVRESEAGPRFVLTWSESGVPPAAPAAAPASGFGTRVLLELVPASVSGEARRIFTSSGMEWTLEAPLSAVTEAR